MIEYENNKKRAKQCGIIFWKMGDFFLRVGEGSKKRKTFEKRISYQNLKIDTQNSLKSL